MNHSEYFDEVLLEDITEVSGRSSYKELSWLLFGFMIVMPAAIVLSVAAEHILMCLLAYVNCLIIGFGVWRFLRKGTLAATVPVLFLPYLTLAWPVATIYFAIFYPTEAYYTVRGGFVSYFESGVKIQLCVLLFISGYFLTMSYALRKEGTETEGLVGNPRLLAFSTLGLGLSIILLNSLSKVTRLPYFITYLADGFFKYLYGLFFIGGALIKKIPVLARFILGGLLALSVLFYTIGNARGMALRPVLMLFVGLLFFSGLNRKTKIILLICLVFAFPTYMVIANTTRLLLGTVGFEEGVSYRLQALKEWRAVKPDRPSTSFVFGRLFFTGGHSIISRTPSEHAYLYFESHLFIREALESLIPQKLYSRPYYRGTRILLDYGFTIIPGVTSVEVSMIGNLWLMGGYFPVFFGGIALGLIHWLLVIILRRNWTLSKMKALLYFGIFAPQLFWGPNLALIGHWRNVVYSIALGFVFYQILRFTIGDPGRGVYALGYEEGYEEAIVDEGT